MYSKSNMVANSLRQDSKRGLCQFWKGKVHFFTMTKRKELCMLATDRHGHKQTLEHSLKIPWRPTKCIAQAKLVHPFLALHSLSALARCHVRSANHLSEHTERTLSRRHRGQGKRLCGERASTRTGSTLSIPFSSACILPRP